MKIKIMKLIFLTSIILFTGCSELYKQTKTKFLGGEEYSLSKISNPSSTPFNIMSMDMETSHLVKWLVTVKGQNLPGWHQNGDSEYVSDIDSELQNKKATYQSIFVKVDKNGETTLFVSKQSQENISKQELESEIKRILPIASKQVELYLKDKNIENIEIEKSKSNNLKSWN